ncbi:MULTISPECIES: diguanylate cyclase [Exiguobacterium]|uniref:diguanylate cyclase n=1 Tax=Exiguobacterium TaxID=33986 RepID=UPI00047E43BE|nr:MULTISPECIES: diguanylate cyclase [Exiguobacterium]
MISTLNIFFLNICIIFLILSVTFYLMRNRLPIQKDSKVSTRFYFGLANGVTGILLIHNSISINGAFIDLRLLPLALSALYGGPISIMTTGSMLLLYRVGMDIGESLTALENSIITLVSFIVLVIFCTWFIKPKGYLFTIIVSIGSFLVLVRMLLGNAETHAWQTIYLPYFLITALASFLFYRLSYMLQDHFVLYSYQSYLASTDQLTRLANRHVIMDKVATLEREQAPWGVILFDLDYFKAVNDQYGHAVGDAVLRHFSVLLTQECPDEVTIGRYGGEEFIAIFPNTLRSSPTEFAQHIVTTVTATPFVMQDHALAITVSAGIAFAQRQPASTVFKQADAALYEAKKNGRNQSYLYSN